VVLYVPMMPKDEGAKSFLRKGEKSIAYKDKDSNL